MERACFNPCTPVDFFNGQACGKCVLDRYLPTPRDNAIDGLGYDSTNKAPVPDAPGGE